MHKKIALEIIGCLHKRYSDASIGLSGSVAMNTFRHNSDIDILFCRKSILSSYSVTFKYKEVSVSIFVFSLGLIEENYMEYLCGYHNMPITFISTSKIIYDPCGIIGNLKEIINDIVRRKVILSKLLVCELEKNAMNLLSLNPKSFYEEKK
ncbi:nucleotidyltransferase domain-containing protein [Bacteroides sp.]